MFDSMRQGYFAVMSKVYLNLWDTGTKLRALKIVWFNSLTLLKWALRSPYKAKPILTSDTFIVTLKITNSKPPFIPSIRLTQKMKHSVCVKITTNHIISAKLFKKLCIPHSTVQFYVQVQPITSDRGAGKKVLAQNTSLRCSVDLPLAGNKTWRGQRKWREISQSEELTEANPGRQTFVLCFPATGWEPSRKGDGNISFPLCDISSHELEMLLIAHAIQKIIFCCRLRTEGGFLRSTHTAVLTQVFH